MTILLRVQRITALAVLPTYAHPNDAGLDLFASDDVVVEVGRTQAVGTGIAIELPPGTEAQVRPRSGLALDHSVTVLNTPGTIDEDYRGEVRVILVNHGQRPFHVEPGMKIAQLVVQPRIHVDVVEVEGLSNTARGTAGFGSTGL